MIKTRKIPKKISTSIAILEIEERKGFINDNDMIIVSVPFDTIVSEKNRKTFTLFKPDICILYELVSLMLSYLL